MKRHTLPTLLAVSALGSGCALHHSLSVSGSRAQSKDNSDGILIVYSAPDPHARFDGSPYNLRYSDYTISSTDGEVPRTVRNDTGTMLEGPAQVHLPPGNYQVQGRSLSKFVTVPVQLKAHQVTVIHLD